MMEFGKALREAREAKGFTVAQLAEQTRLAPGTIDELENENFKRIAAPIYGRGFVRLYCEAVGLDPAPYIAEFMEILNGNREPTIRERAIVEPPVAAPEPPAAPEPIPKPPQKQPNLFQTDPLPAPPPVAAPMPPPTRPAAVEHAPNQLSRYAAPVRVLQNTPPAVWRLGALAIAAIALLVLLGFGLRALRRATAPVMPDEARASSAESRPAPNGDVQKAARTPQEISPLYLD